MPDSSIFRPRPFRWRRDRFDQLAKPPVTYLLLAPTLSSALPEAQRPGEKLLLNGGNFLLSLDTARTTVHLASAQEGTFNAHILADGKMDKEGWKAEVVTTTQILLTLGLDLPPGVYDIRVSTFSSGGARFSDPVRYEVLAWRFTVAFIGFDCLDESNETSGSDEVMALWGLAADDMVTERTSQIYTDIDAGGTYSFTEDDKHLLPVPTKVRHQLTIIARMYETDIEGDVFPYPLREQLHHVEKLREILDAAQPLLASADVADALSSIVDDTSNHHITVGSDNLGEQRAVFSARDLMHQTRNPQRTFFGELPFNNPDSEGSHVMHYQISRIRDQLYP
jgi:hypothetical protein